MLDGGGYDGGEDDGEGDEGGRDGIVGGVVCGVGKIYKVEDVGGEWEWVGEVLEKDGGVEDD